MPESSNEGIAIIGIGCRFPGGVNDIESFWKLLVEGREAVSDVPPDRWNVERFYDAEPGLAGKTVARRGGFVDGLDQFDPQFFGISPREAPYVDPMHRLLLETSWEAIEDARAEHLISNTRVHLFHVLECVQSALTRLQRGAIFSRRSR